MIPDPYSIQLMLDHQSGPDDLFPFRTHVYAGASWGRHIDAQLFDTVLDYFGPGEIEEIMSYVVHALGEDSPVYAIIIDTLSKAVKEVYVTIADKLRAEGRKEGREEGRVSAAAEMLLRMLDHRAWPIPASIRDRVLATADERLLQRWFDRALAAASVEEVFQPLEA